MLYTSSTLKPTKTKRIEKKLHFIFVGLKQQCKACIPSYRLPYLTVDFPHKVPLTLFFSLHAHTNITKYSSSVFLKLPRNPSNDVLKVPHYIETSQLNSFTN